jgi:hypothetical protein
VKRPVYNVDSNVTIPPGKAPQTTGASKTGAPGQYQVNRPAYNTDNVRLTRNILRGKVRSGDTGNLEGGVRVILSSRTNAFTDRVVTTDATGHYAVRLPDGDWTVNVVMPSGRAYAVSQLTISGGEIIDDLGRNVPSLTITR